MALLITHRKTRRFKQFAFKPINFEFIIMNSKTLVTDELGVVLRSYRIYVIHSMYHIIYIIMISITC